VEPPPPRRSTTAERQHSAPTGEGPIAHEVGEADLRARYQDLDPLPGAVETVIGADSTLPQTVDRIVRETDLDRLPARE
jgi:hypothetical protein